MIGWIAIHRQITENWVWNDPKRLKWWLTILLYVNHDQCEVRTSQGKHLIKPGESFRSIEAWAGLFDCSKRTALKFFTELEEEGMIRRATPGKGNRRKHLLSVEKWEDYQKKRNWKVNPKVAPDSTSNNNEDNEDNKSTTSSGLSFEEFWDEYHERTGLPKTDKVDAEKQWEKLTRDEQRKAIDNIPDYVAANPGYRKKGRTYLSSKSFDDEFDKKRINGRSGIERQPSKGFT